MTIEELEEIIPCPMAIDIYVELDAYDVTIDYSLEAAVEQHNESWEPKLDAEQMRLSIHDISDYSDFDYEITVAGESVLKAKFVDDFNNSESCEDTLFDKCVEQILEVWHNKIYQQQLENEKILKELEYEGKYEILLMYCKFHQRDRRFFFIKKLAEKNSAYRKYLVRAYRGQLGQKYVSYRMAKKLGRSRRKKLEKF